MPSAVVHLKAAYDLKDILSVKDTGQFYVGAVSPDAVNIDGFAPQDVRYPAHIRSTDYAQWKHNVADYITDKSDDYKNNTDFFKGFLLHILTDIFWDELVQPLLFSALQENGAAAQQLRELKWQELYRFNAALAGDWLYKEVLPKIGEVTRFDGISTVTPDLLEKYVRHLTTDYMEKKAIDEKPLILSERMLAPVEQACVEFLKKYKVI